MRQRKFLAACTGLAFSAALMPLFLTGCCGSSDTSSQPPADLIGTWGGGTVENPASLQVVSGGGTLTFECGANDQLTQPLTVDGQGHFDVTATPHGSLPVVLPPGTPPAQVHLSGTVTGRTMTLTETDASGQATTYVLTYGQAAPTFTGACPG